MSQSTRVAELVHRIERIASASDEAALIERLTSPGATRTLAFINAHAVNLAWSDPSAARAFAEADIILRDGKGMEILDRMGGRDPGLNMNGTDLIPHLLAASRGRSLAVFGTRDPWLGEACARLRAEGHHIVAQLDGFRSEADYLAEVDRTQPEIVLLAMGMPRQEQLACLLRATRPEGRALIICGGAIVDFLAGRVSRAPGWLRRTGLEWAYRLVLEPRRLFRRYVLGNVLFLARMNHINAAFSEVPEALN